MAKYLLKTSLIAPLKTRGIVSAEDMMTLRIPHRVQNTKEQMFELTFDITEAVETDNRLAKLAIEQKHSPSIKVGGEWYIADPSIAWFDKLEDADPTTSNQPHVHGDEVLTHPDRDVIRRHIKATGATKPVSWKKTDADAALATAVTYFTSP